jgi:hypothetical protein
VFHKVHDLAVDPVNKAVYVTELTPARIWKFSIVSGELSYSSTTHGNFPFLCVIQGDHFYGATSSYVYDLVLYCVIAKVLFPVVRKLMTTISFQKAMPPLCQPHICLLPKRPQGPLVVPLIYHRVPPLSKHPVPLRGHRRRQKVKLLPPHHPPPNHQTPNQLNRLRHLQRVLFLQGQFQLKTLRQILLRVATVAQTPRRLITPHRRPEAPPTLGTPTTMPKTMPK